MGWGQQCRLRHVTSGRYLAVTHEHQVITVHRQKADERSVAFFLYQSKVCFVEIDISMLVKTL